MTSNLEILSLANMISWLHFPIGIALSFYYAYKSKETCKAMHINLQSFWSFLCSLLKNNIVSDLTHKALF